MKFLSNLLSKLTLASSTKTTNRKKTIEDYQQDILNKQGREQFSKLVEKGLRLPIAVL